MQSIINCSFTFFKYNLTHSYIISTYSFLQCHHHREGKAMYRRVLPLRCRPTEGIAGSKLTAMFQPIINAVSSPYLLFLQIINKTIIFYASSPGHPNIIFTEDSLFVCLLCRNTEMFQVFFLSSSPSSSNKAYRHHHRRQLVCPLKRARHHDAVVGVGRVVASHNSTVVVYS